MIDTTLCLMLTFPFICCTSFRLWVVESCTYPTQASQPTPADVVATTDLKINFNHLCNFIWLFTCFVFNSITSLKLWHDPQYNNNFSHMPLFFSLFFISCNCFSTTHDGHLDTESTTPCKIFESIILYPQLGQ